jgi:hypothetical protein
MTVHKDELKRFSLTELELEAETVKHLLDAAGHVAPTLDTDERARAKHSLETVRDAAAGPLARFE